MREGKKERTDQRVGITVLGQMPTQKKERMCPTQQHRSDPYSNDKKEGIDAREEEVNLKK